MGLKKKVQKQHQAGTAKKVSKTSKIATNVEEEQSMETDEVSFSKANCFCYLTAYPRETLKLKWV